MNIIGHYVKSSRKVKTKKSEVFPLNLCNTVFTPHVHAENTSMNDCLPNPHSNSSIIHFLFLNTTYVSHVKLNLTESPKITPMYLCE